MSLDWSHLRAISCDDVVAQLRDVLPDATVQAQRNATERGWEFSVEQGGVHYHVAICDADMEDGKIVAAKVLEVVGMAHTQRRRTRQQRAGLLPC